MNTAMKSDLDLDSLLDEIQDVDGDTEIKETTKKVQKLDAEIKKPATKLKGKKAPAESKASAPVVKETAPVVKETAPVVQEKKEPKEPKEKRVTMHQSTSDILAYGLTVMPDNFTADASITPSEDSRKEFLQSLEAVPIVKVREKLVNLINFVAHGATLSRYSLATIKLLDEKGAITKAEISNNFLDIGVKIGTASSQSGQMSKLLLVAKIATFEDGRFVANPDSIIAEMAKSL
jgi:hypothetical protein